MDWDDSKKTVFNTNSYLKSPAVHTSFECLISSPVQHVCRNLFSMPYLPHPYYKFHFIVFLHWRQTHSISLSSIASDVLSTITDDQLEPDLYNFITNQRQIHKTNKPLKVHQLTHSTMKNSKSSTSSNINAPTLANVCP